MKYKFILLSLCFLIGSQFANAQISSGSITMGVTEFDMPSAEGQEGMDQMKGMMEDMGMTIHFKPGHQVTEVNAMGMINIKMHYVDNVMTQYMDMMGQKIKVVSPMGENAFAHLGLDAEAMKDMYRVNYDKSATKEILGYNCYKATIKMNLEALSPKAGDIPDEIKNMEMDMYVTNEIDMEQISLQNIPGLQLEGAPLQMDLNMGMMTMTYEATNIDTDPDDSLFEVPEGEYKEMTLEAFQNMTGGFGKR